MAELTEVGNFCHFKRIIVDARAEENATAACFGVLVITVAMPIC